jgi:5'(3')-deoxyribonucleotidase
MKKQKIFIDLDGVMADFDKHFPEAFGVDKDTLSDIEMWAMINSNPTFFLDLPLCVGAKDFFESVEHKDPIILTACPKSNYTVAATQKREWVRNNLSKDVLVMPIMGGKNKCLFMHSAGDLLIDDFEKNCKPWDDMGGISITHRNFGDTVAEMKWFGFDV